MAVTHEQIIDFLLTNPSDAEVAKAMETYKVSPADIAKATGTSEGEIAARVAATLPPNQAVLLGDTWVQPQYQTIGSGEDQQIGPIESVSVYKTTGDVGDKIAVGTDIKQYSPTGEYVSTSKSTEDKSFFGGLADAFNDPVVQAAFLGLGGGGALGNALGLTGSTAQAVGTGLFKGGAAAAGGASLEDALKTGLLSGGLVYGGSELAKTLNTAGGAVLGDASDIALKMADSGKTLTEIETALKNSGFSADVVAESLKDAANSLAPRAINIPSDISQLTDGVNVVGQFATPSLSNVLSTIAATTPVAVSTPVKDAGTVKVETAKTPQQVDQAVLDLINSQLAANVTTPANTANVQVTGQKPATVQEVINAITTALPTVTPTQAATIAEQVVTSNKPVTTQEVINAIAATLPAVVTPTVTTPTVAEQVVTDKRPSSITDDVTAATIPLIQPSTPLKPTQVTAEKELSNSEKIRLAQLGLTAAGLLGAGVAASSGSGGTQFPIVPIPESWATPPKTGVAPYMPLTPINFGNRNLLIGTQWEKFLDPNYGKVPAPVQYSQPSNLSYNDLMGILGSKQGMPSASSLSINDIISGIQNQYGQANRSAMG